MSLVVVGLPSKSSLSKFPRTRNRRKVKEENTNHVQQMKYEKRKTPYRSKSNNVSLEESQERCKMNIIVVIVHLCKKKKTIYKQGVHYINLSMSESIYTNSKSIPFLLHRGRWFFINLFHSFAFCASFLASNRVFLFFLFSWEFQSVRCPVSPSSALLFPLLLIFS